MSVGGGAHAHQPARRAVALDASDAEGALGRSRRHVPCLARVPDVPLGTMLFERLLGAAHVEMTSALLNLQMDAAVLLGTAGLLVYKDFVQQQQHEDAQHVYLFFCASCWRCGFAIAGLMLVAEVAFGMAVDRSRRAAKQLDAAAVL